jgi:hypothetical protein
MDKLTLTDDEAAALALRAGGAWVAPLPTINGADRAEVTAAVLRGRRSLVVRDLGTPGGDPVGAAADVLKRLGAGPRAWFMLRTAEDAWFHRGPTVYLYGPSITDVELSHLVAPVGVHYFTASPPAGEWEALTTLAEAIHADGFTAAEPDLPGVPPPTAALLTVVHAGGARSIRVSQGAVTTGRGPVPAKFPGIAEATAWLLT